MQDSGKNNELECSADDSVEEFVVLTGLHEAVVPGLPSPMTGARFDALVENVRQNGVLQPLLVDELNGVWDGRSRLRACRQLGITRVPVKYIQLKDGLRLARAAAMKRQWTPLEMAMTIQWVQESEELRKLCEANPGKKSNSVIGIWMSRELGMVKGVSPRQVTSYLQLAKRYADIESAAERMVIDEAATLHAALKALPGPGAKHNRRRLIPEKICRRALDRFVKVLHREFGDQTCLEEVISQIAAAVTKLTTSSEAK